MPVPKIMSTQHPDNVTTPFFAESDILQGEDEIQEAYYAYSHLGCDEQMWDFEGKEVDNSVVKKLLTKQEDFFRTHVLGRDIHLTYRVPNPDVEKTEAKILLETLESIPRSYDAAKIFYGNDIAPIHEVIIPLCSDADAMNRIYSYYKDFVVGKSSHFVHGKNIEEWIGSFNPKTINVIPLFEEKEHMLQADDTIKKYLHDKDIPYQRVFLARSDPAVNYGSISAVLINKIALQRLYKLSKKLHIPIYPIIGAGSAPFRGNLRPQTVDGILQGYPSVQTFTIQSSFKFDHPVNDVQQAIKKIKQHERSAPVVIDEIRTQDIIERYSTAYKAQLIPLTSAINTIATYIPKRRKRKLHIGLFGYSRNVDDISLPRAIAFTASLYSLGVPPELLGLDALTDDDWSYIQNIYPNVLFDLSDPLQYADISSPYFPSILKPIIQKLRTQQHDEHISLTQKIVEQLHTKKYDECASLVLRAAHIRGFLG